MTRALFIFLAVLAAIVWLAPQLAPFDPMLTRATEALLPPNSVYFFGTDALGRDVFSRVLHGGARTLISAGVALIVATVPSVLLGLSIGFIGGWLDRVAQIIITAFLALPSYLLTLVILTVLGQGDLTLAFAVGFALIAPFFQTMRATAIGIRSREYILAAHALGATRLQIFYRYVLPNSLPTLLSYGSVTLSYCILNIGAFGFLGLMGSPGVPEWGVMLAEGREVFREAPWVSAAPGVCISVLIFSINQLSQSLTPHE